MSSNVFSRYGDSLFYPPMRSAIYTEGNAPVAPLASFVGAAISLTGLLDISATGRQAGDLCVVLNWAQNDSIIPTTAVPAGFDQILPAISGSGWQAGNFTLSKKELAGTETTLALMTATYQDAIAFVFRKTSGTWGTPSSIVSVSNFAGGLSPDNITIPCSAGTGPLIALASTGTGRGNDKNDHSNFPAQMQGSVFDAQYLSAGYKIYNTAPADLLVSVNQAGTQPYLAGLYIPLT